MFYLIYGESPHFSNAQSRDSKCLWLSNLIRETSSGSDMCLISFRIFCVISIWKVFLYKINEFLIIFLRLPRVLSIYIKIMYFALHHALIFLGRFISWRKSGSQSELAVVVGSTFRLFASVFLQEKQNFWLASAFPFFRFPFFHQVNPTLLLTSYCLKFFVCHGLKDVIHLTLQILRWPIRRKNFMNWLIKECFEAFVEWSESHP